MTSPQDPQDPQDPQNPQNPGSTSGNSTSYDSEGPDDVPGMDDQTSRDPQHDEAPPPDEVTAPDEATAPGEVTAPCDAAADGSAAHDVTPDGSGPAAGAGGGAGAGSGLDDLTLSSDEATLRALMHDAVDGLHASPDALERLRHAVPQRRQRRRQAMFGAAAAVVLVGLAVPTVLRATSTSGPAGASPVGAGSAYSATPEAGGHSKGGAADPSGRATYTSGDSARQPADAPTGPAATPSGTRPPAPDCSGAQLGQGASQADTPDAGGRVYGWFRVSNVSDAPCTVPSGGVVRAVAHGSAEQGAIQVVGHTQGDPASGLPTDLSAAPIVLAPGQDYEVAFAWVPTGTAGTDGCASTTPVPATSTPTPSATDTSGPAEGEDSGGSDNGAQPPAGDPTPDPPSSVTLDHTPAAGAPVVSGPVIKGACAGTVYTTPPMPEADATPAP